MPQDDAEAVRWYRLAAEQGHVSAQNNLGVMYSTGDLRVTRPASRLSRRRESETVMRIPTLVIVPSPGKRGRRLRPSLVGEGYRSGLGQTDSLGPPGRSDTYGLPGGVPVGLVATCQKPTTGIRRREIGKSGWT